MKSVLCIDHYKSMYKSRAMLSTAKSVGARTIFIYISDHEQFQHDYFDEFYRADTFKDALALADSIIQNQNVAYAFTTTDFLTPIVNELLLKNHMKYPIANNSDDVHALVSKFRFNEEVLARLNRPKIDSWMITDISHFDSIYEEYSGPVYVKLEWGMAGGNRLAEYDCRPYPSILEFKKHLISTGQLQKFINENKNGIEFLEAYNIHIDETFGSYKMRRVVQKYLRWENGYGVYNYFIDKKFIATQNHFREGKQLPNNYVSPYSTFNVSDNNFHPSLFEAKKDTNNFLQSFLNTSPAHFDVYVSNGVPFVSDINLRIGGTYASAILNSRVGKDIMSALQKFFKHVLYDEISEPKEYDTTHLGVVGRGGVKIRIDYHDKSDEFIETACRRVWATIPENQDYKIEGCERLIDALKMVKWNKPHLNFSIDVVYYISDNDDVYNLELMLENKIGKEIEKVIYDT